MSVAFFAGCPHILLRNISDRICEEHGIETIKNPKGKGKSYYEWLMEKNGKSYKKRLKDNIDALIPAIQSYGELLIKMQELGYEIKSGRSILAISFLYGL